MIEYQAKRWPIMIEYQAVRWPLIISQATKLPVMLLSGYKMGQNVDHSNKDESWYVFDQDAPIGQAISKISIMQTVKLLLAPFQWI